MKDGLTGVDENAVNMWVLRKLARFSELCEQKDESSSPSQFNKGCSMVV